MNLLMGLIIGGVYAAGVYLLLSRNMVRLLIGIVLLGHATNLLLLTAGGLTREAPPIIPADRNVPDGPVANPLPQALILTAIVIGLGLQAFLLALIYQTARRAGTSDLRAMTSEEIDAPG